jgi:hypothetical protein
MMLTHLQLSSADIDDPHPHLNLDFRLSKFPLSLLPLSARLTLQAVLPAIPLCQSLASDFINSSSPRCTFLLDTLFSSLFKRLEEGQ